MLHIYKHILNLTSHCNREPNLTHKIMNLLKITIIVSFLIGTILISCKKERTENIPAVTTTTILEITHISAISGGEIVDDKGLTITARGICWSTNITPTIQDNKTVDGSGAGSFKSTLTGLKGSTKYYVRAYATNRSGTGYGMTLSFNTDEVVIDVDGNEYPILSLGNQVWMAENLKTTKYNNNKSISFPSTDYVLWQNNTDGAYALYENKLTNKNIYGALYNWYAVNTGNLCPTGWHIPSKTEVTTLLSFLGTNPGDKLKEVGTVHWYSNPYATNLSGFTALPGGILNIDGKSYGIGSVGYWWLSDELTVLSGAKEGYNYQLSYDSRSLSVSGNEKSFGFSIRCIRN